MKRIIIVAFFLCCTTTILAQLSSEQQRKLDSLNTVIKIGSHDTAIGSAYTALVEILYSSPDTLLALSEKAIFIAERGLKKATGKERKAFLKIKAEALSNLGYYHQNNKDVDKAVLFYDQAIPLHREAGNKLGEASAITNLGLLYFNRGEVLKAIEYSEIGLRIRQGTGDKDEISHSFNNLGLIYKNQGDIMKALDYYHQSLKLREQVGNKRGTANTLSNIGFIYQTQGDYAKAVECFDRSFKIYQELNDRSGIAYAYSNMGLAYTKRGDHVKALEYHSKSMEIREAIADKAGICTSLYNIGFSYFKLKESSKALEYFQRALAESKAREDKRGIALAFMGLGDLYQQMENNKKAVENHEKALSLANELGFPDLICSSAGKLSVMYKQQGSYLRALEMYDLQVRMRDSINNVETRKAATKKQFQYEYEKKKLADSIQFVQAQQVMDLELNRKEAQLQQEQTQRYALYGGIGLMVVLAGVSFASYRRKKRDTEIITRQKEEVEQQKHLLEEKNKEVLASIAYAKRLQDAILPPQKLWTEQLPGSFVLYLPKDIVAGDFYWMETAGSKIMFAAADCTGHGVPGALVSVVCSNALNRAVKEFHLYEPGKVLDKVTELVLETFEKSENEVKDGMDISLCCFDRSDRALTWAGANNPLWIIRGNDHIAEMPGTNEAVFEELKADKQPVGKFEKAHPFTTHTLQLSEGDSLYIFTDGYADQFGGGKGKKFKYSNLKHLLLNISHLSPEQQKQELSNAITEWKGNLEQVDDICLVGVRV